MAEKKYVQRIIQIPKGYDADAREAIAMDVLDEIRRRSRGGIDRFGDKFPDYSTSYTHSLNFKNAGGKSKPKLVMSGDMLAEMDLINDDEGKLVIGFDPSTAAADRAEGNIRGTYGQDRGSSAKARDFLGLPKDVLRKILDKYPLSDEEKLNQRVDRALARNQAAREKASEISGEEV